MFLAHSQSPTWPVRVLLRSKSPTVSSVREKDKETGSSVLDMPCAFLQRKPTLPLCRSNSCVNTSHTHTHFLRRTWTHIPGPRLIHSSPTHPLPETCRAHSWTHYLCLQTHRRTKGYTGPHPHTPPLTLWAPPLTISSALTHTCPRHSPDTQVHTHASPSHLGNALVLSSVDLGVLTYLQPTAPTAFPTHLGLSGGLSGPINSLGGS